MSVVDAWSEPLVIHCQKVTGLALIGQLLLALRHPENRGDSADVVRSFARDLAMGLLIDPSLNIPIELRLEWQRDLFGGEEIHV